MGLIPSPLTMKSLGLTRLWNGLRTGDQRSVLFGAGLFAFSWLRLNREPKKTLLYRKTLPEGSSFVIRTGKPGDLPEIEVLKKP